MLPVIYFIFSRAGCDAAALAILESGIRLTDPDDRPEIRRIAEERTAHLTDADLGVLGYDRWIAGLEAGVAAHHAGMVPAFKETVEELFAAGMLGAVFATETLALGINMPARSVVLESLSKFNGETHELMQARRLHPAHRPGGPARHRRGRLRDRAPLQVRPFRSGDRDRRRRQPPSRLELPAHLQHGGQPGRQLPARSISVRWGSGSSTSGSVRSANAVRSRNTPAWLPPAQNGGPRSANCTLVM
jgi:hypothetical protein